LGQVFTKKMDL